jgi:hypothetical protein
MLFALLHRNIEGFHPRQIPKPDASMVHQQLQTLLPLEAWWVHLLETGRPWGNSFDTPHLAISEAFEDEEEIGEFKRHKKRLCLYDQARASSPRLRNESYNYIAAFLRKQGCVSQKVYGRRGWCFPPLAECRKRWLERFPAWRWQDESIADWEPEVTYEPGITDAPRADLAPRGGPLGPEPPLLASRRRLLNETKRGLRQPANRAGTRAPVDRPDRIGRRKCVHL